MVYMYGLYLTLRSGQKHCSLSVSPIKLVEPVDGIPHLIYTENISKNNPEGKAEIKKPCKRQGTTQILFDGFYKVYMMAHCPKDVTHDAFYQPLIRNSKTVIHYGTIL